MVNIYAITWYLLTQLIWMGTMLMGLALTIKTILGAHPLFVVAIVGFITLFYTNLGGFKSIVYTDFVQFIFLGIGTIGLFIYLFSQFNIPLLMFALETHTAGKWALGTTVFSLSQPSVLVIIS